MCSVRRAMATRDAIPHEPAPSVGHWDDHGSLYRWDRPFKVFLAEDDEGLRESLAEVLRLEGHEVAQAADGETLGELLASDARFLLANHSTMIVSDVRLPGKSGVELLRHLRASRWRTPVLLMTAFGTRELSEEVKALGESFVLHKPFSRDVFIELVRLFCTHRSLS